MSAGGAPFDTWVAYASGAFGLSILIVRSLPKVFGPIGRYVVQWTDSRQQLRNRHVAAEVSELQTSVKVLQDSLADLRAKAKIHADWDRKVYGVLVTNGIADGIGVPPDLF